MNTPSPKGQIHEEIEKIFRTLLPRNGLAVREEQVALCHIMLDALLKNNIALCDAGVGIGKTYAYLTACILCGRHDHRHRSCRHRSHRDPAGQRPCDARHLHALQRQHPPTAGTRTQDRADRGRNHRRDEGY